MVDTISKADKAERRGIPSTRRGVSAVGQGCTLLHRDKRIHTPDYRLGRGLSRMEHKKDTSLRAGLPPGMPFRPLCEEAKMRDAYYCVGRCWHADASRETLVLTVNTLHGSVRSFPLDNPISLTISVFR